MTGRRRDGMPDPRTVPFGQETPWHPDDEPLFSTYRFQIDGDTQWRFCPTAAVERLNEVNVFVALLGRISTTSRRWLELHVSALLRFRSLYLIQLVSFPSRRKTGHRFRCMNPKCGKSTSESYLDAHPRAFEEACPWCGAFVQNPFIPGPRIPPLERLRVEPTKVVTFSPVRLPGTRRLTLGAVGHRFHISRSRLKTILRRYPPLPPDYLPPIPQSEETDNRALSVLFRTQSPGSPPETVTIRLARPPRISFVRED